MRHQERFVSSRLCQDRAWKSTSKSFLPVLTKKGVIHALIGVRWRHRKKRNEQESVFRNSNTVFSGREMMDVDWDDVYQNRWHHRWGGELSRLNLFSFLFVMKTETYQTVCFERWNSGCFHCCDQHLLAPCNYRVQQGLLSWCRPYYWASYLVEEAFMRWNELDKVDVWHVEMV